MKFKCITCDPPWKFKTHSEKGMNRSAENHYQTMTNEDILALGKYVKEVADKHCVLILWTSPPHAAFAMKVLEAWGFEYKSEYPWLKVNKDGTPKINNGYHARACTEKVIIATKGKPPCPKPSDRPIGFIKSVPGRHSEKPFDIYRRAELYKGPYLEMFARDNGQLSRENWTFIGNEITGNDITHDLEALAIAK